MSGLTEEAKLILKGAVSSLSGRVMCEQCMDGALRFKADGKVLMESYGRAIAVWESALEELVTQGLLKKQVDYPHTQVFLVTEKGDEYAKSLGFLS